MSFAKELENVFDIDIWELKPEYKPQIDTDTTKISIASDIVPCIVSDTLIYTNNSSSSKVINIVISNDSQVTFVKVVSKQLFSKSRVNIYKHMNNSSSVDNSINILSSEFINDDLDLLGVANKKYILEKLYPYADFKTK